MMQPQFKTWTVALACSALVLIVTPHSIAQTSSKGTTQQEMAKQKTLMSDGSQKVMDASKKMREAMRILDTKRDYAKAKQLLTEADKTMAEGQKLIAEAENIDVTLLQDLRRNEDARRQTHTKWNADGDER
jgi:HD superfamily phosphodiesterase